MIFEYYEKHIAEALRIWSYFGIIFLFLFLGARAISFKHYWECVTHLATAMFFILLFVIVLARNRDLTDYLLTPYLFVWLIATLLFLYNTVFKDNITYYIDYIKNLIKDFQ